MTARHDQLVLALETVLARLGSADALGAETLMDGLVQQLHATPAPLDDVRVGPLVQRCTAMAATLKDRLEAELKQAATFSRAAAAYEGEP